MIHVFGAILVDAIACRSSIAPITIRTGGVGYNIFQALEPGTRRLVTALGDGPFSQHARQALEAEAQVLLRTVPGRDTGLYLAFMERGRLLFGATDASAFEDAMDEAFLDQALASVAPGDLVVADANLLPGPLSHLGRALRERGAWLVFETVSVTGLHAWLALQESRLPDAANRRALAGAMPDLLRQAMEVVERTLAARASTGG